MLALTEQDETNIVAAFALAAQQYADPSGLLETLEKISLPCRRAADTIREQLEEAAAMRER